MGRWGEGALGFGLLLRVSGKGLTGPHIAPVWGIWAEARLMSPRPNRPRGGAHASPSAGVRRPACRVCGLDLSDGREGGGGG